MGITLPFVSDLSAALSNVRQWATTHQTISSVSPDQWPTTPPLETPLRLAKANEEQLNALKQEAQRHTSSNGINEPRCVAELPKKDSKAPTRLLYSATEENGVCYVRFDTPRGEAVIGAQTIGYVPRSSIIAFETGRDWISRQLESFRRRSPIVPIEPPRYNSDMIMQYRSFEFLKHQSYSRIAEAAANSLTTGAWDTYIR